MRHPKRLEASTCSVCGKEFKGLGAMKAHVFYKHKGLGGGTTCPPVSPSEGEVSASPSKVMFRSPKAFGLRLVLKPSYWSRVETPAGMQQIMVQGKVIEFREGVLETDDPEVIDYLENKYSSGRYPVISPRQLQRKGRGL